jgi:hypothetical protein
MTHYCSWHLARVAHRGTPMHRIGTGAPKAHQKLATVHRAKFCPAASTNVKAVMFRMLLSCVGCSVWQASLATLSPRVIRVARSLEVVSKASTPEISLLSSVDLLRLTCTLSSRPPVQSLALQSARNGRFSPTAIVLQKA